MNQPSGDEIVTLLGISESDDKILDLFEALEVDKDNLERDEDDGSFWIELEDIGLSLEFNNMIPEKYRNPQYIGGQYLVNVSLNYNFKPFPYGLTDEDSLDIIEKKLNARANYVLVDDNSTLVWLYEDLGDILIEFEDETWTSIIEIRLSLYQEPSKSDDFDEVMKPFKR